MAVQSAKVQGETLGGPFAPGIPLTPYDGVSGLPRAWDFPTGYNIKARADRDGRLDFKLLKALTDTYDVAAACINHRIDDVRSLDWSVRPADWVERGDGDSDFIDKAKAALRKPDGRNTFRSWLAMYLQDVLRYDAGALYRRRNMAGQVCALEVVSGTTIAPVLDYWGRRPEAPAPAYVQYVNGQPWEWLTSDDLIYQPFRPQPDSPYGVAPLEHVLLTANTHMRFQKHWMDWFTEGNIPEGFATAPADLTTPEQLEKWEAYWDAMNTDSRVKHKLKMIPNGTDLTFPAEKSFDSTFPLYLMRVVCAAYHVTPNDLGFTEDVNRATGDTQVDVQFRIGTLPLVQHIQDILTAYLQDDLGLPVVFEFDTGQESEDRVATAQADKIYMDSAVISPDEVRERRYGLPTNAARPVPRSFDNSRQGRIPLRSLYAVAGAIDPQTGAPAEDVPLDTTPFAGTPGIVPDKQPGAPQFARAPIDPDDPMRPALEAPVPGSGVVAPPAAPAQQDPAVTKSGPTVAGIAVKAEDTGRVLMIQRTLDPDDPAAGRWEFPGGHLEEGETAYAAAVREWQEETGLPFPSGTLVATWATPDGVYMGHVVKIPSEDVLPINDGHGEDGETLAWFDPSHLDEFAALRQELQADLPAVELSKAIAKELRRWKANTLTRLGRGQRPRLFESDILPDETIRKVWTYLDAATDTGSVEGAFAQALGTDAGPKAGTPSWRDDPPVRTPQHDVDLQLTDYYAPKVAKALRALWSKADLSAAIQHATYNRVVKDQTPPPPDAAAAALLGSADTDPLTAQLQAMNMDAYDVGIDAAQVQLGVTPEGWASWKPGLDPQLVTGSAGWQAAMDQAGVSVKDITATTASRLGTAIEQGVAAGNSVDGIAKELNSILGDPARAELIAHTESSRMLTNAALGQYAQMGVTEWDMVTSAGACPICLDIAAANPHPVKDSTDQPPAHPRCRCAASPHVESMVAPPVDPDTLTPPLDATAVATVADTLTSASTAGWSDERLMAAITDYADDPEAVDKILSIIDERDAAAQAAENLPPVKTLDELAADLRPSKDGSINPAARASRNLTPADKANEEYDTYVYNQYSKALDDLAGNFFNNKNRAAALQHGYDEMTLFQGSYRNVEKYASEELKQWWYENGRETQGSFRYKLLNRPADKRFADVVQRLGFGQGKASNDRSTF